MTTLGVRCSHKGLDRLFERIQGFVSANATNYNMFGRPVRGYRVPDTPSIWIRDNSDMMRAYKYWEPDITSMVDHFAEMQGAKGWIFDYFTMTPEKVPCERENWAKYVRVPVEADVEFRFVKAVYQAWQATGDDTWLQQILPVVEKALLYVLSDPWRWDKKKRLVKRAFTVDTWDFDYTAGRYPWLNFRVDDNTSWCIMHGDNSGYYEAFANVARMYAHLKKAGARQTWQRRADDLRTRANRTCYNGTFYTHQVHLTPVTIPGLEESRQISLSNPMDINRGMATHAMAVAILREYQRRGEATGAFAPWWSIDPPFPDGIFGDEKIVGGAYCNGGIMPLVGGELAHAALEHGFETYGIRQLEKYEELTRDDTSYLWYFPDGRHSTIETSTSPDASPKDAWGSSAMLYALMEGVAGIVDGDALWRDVRLAPRWVAADVLEASARAAYGSSGTFFGYDFVHRPAQKMMALEVEGKAAVHLHLLLPPGTTPVAVRANGRTIRHKSVAVESSRYVDADFRVAKKTNIIVEYR